jgi:hypothetical protein
MDKTADFITWMKETRAETAEHPLFHESVPDRVPDDRRGRPDLRIVDDTPTNDDTANE